jgi:hypothetical protein
LACDNEHDNDRSLHIEVNEVVEIKLDIEDDKRTGILGVVDFNSSFLTVGGVVRFIEILKLTCSSS